MKIFRVGDFQESKEQGEEQERERNPGAMEGRVWGPVDDVEGWAGGTVVDG